MIGYALGAGTNAVAVAVTAGRWSGVISTPSMNTMLRPALSTRPSPIQGRSELAPRSSISSRWSEATVAATHRPRWTLRLQHGDGETTLNVTEMIAEGRLRGEFDFDEPDINVFSGAFTGRPNRRSAAWGLDLHHITLGALIIALGLLVDFRGWLS